MALRDLGRADVSTAQPQSFNTDQLVIALDSAASIIAGVRRAVAAERRAPAKLEAEWRSFDTLGAIAGEWQNLAARALEPNVFYHPAFALPAASVFGRGCGAVLVWSNDTTRQLAGFFPARIAHARNGYAFPVLTGWTHPYAPYGTPLVAREAADATIIAWLEFLSRAPELPRLLMLPLVPDGPFAQALDRALDRLQMPAAEFGRHQRALLAPRDQPDGYVARALGHKKNKELRRLHRRLGEQGRLELRSAREGADINTALAAFFALEAGGWKGRAGSAAAQHADIRAFMQNAVAALAARGQAGVHLLNVDERPIAAAITLRSADTVRFWKIAYDEAYASFSPGVLLSVELTEYLLCDPSIARVDSCADADHPMINHLWRERLTLSDRLIGVRDGVPFALASRLETWRRAAINGAKHARNLLRRHPS